MNFKVQRFREGHPLFSRASVTNTDASRGVVGTFRPVFGQLLDNAGNYICFTMERAETLIPNGVYKYDLYNSPHNKRIVPRLIEDEKGVDISQRVIEVHPANWLWQLKGCTAPGLVIDLTTSSIMQSRLAFDKVKALIGNDTGGTITYEYLNEAT